MHLSPFTSFNDGLKDCLENEMVSGSVLGAVHTLQPLIRILDTISNKAGYRETSVALRHLTFTAKAMSGKTSLHRSFVMIC